MPGGFSSPAPDAPPQGRRRTLIRSFVGVFGTHYMANWFGNGGGPFMYFTSQVGPYGFVYGDYSLSETIGDLNSTKEIAYRDAHAAQRSPLVPAQPQGVGAQAASSGTSAFIGWGGSSPTATEFRVEASTDQNFLANIITILAPAGARQSGRSMACSRD